MELDLCQHSKLLQVMAMFDQTEKSAADLLKKKQIVEADRAKIAQAINELDAKKNETLQKAHEQVLERFLSMPPACLQPP